MLIFKNSQKTILNHKLVLLAIRKGVFIFSVIFITTLLVLIPIYFINQLTKPKDLNILLITIDALRPDHLTCYGYKRNTSPRIDEIAKEGILFTQAISQGSRTWPFLTSLITSAYQSTHQVYFENQLLSYSISTLPEILKRKGYYTGFISGHGSLWSGKESGFKRGFDTCEDFGANADKISHKAIGWIKENKDKKFFLWLHYFDPHGPYMPPQPYKTRYVNDGLYKHNKHIPISPDDAVDRHSRKKAIGKGEIPAYVAEDNITDIDYYIAQYDGEINFTDEQIGILLDLVKELGLIKNTLIIITADHGEYLGDHGFYFMHGGLYDTIIKIPLIMKCKGIFPHGKIIDQQISSIDIMPTILSAVKIKVDIKMDGVSLLPVICGRYYNRPYAFGEFMNPQGVFTRSIRNKNWKLIFDVVKNTYELYDLKKDPRELTNLINTRINEFKFLKSELEKWAHTYKHNMVTSIGQLDEQTKNRLMSLGYVK